MPRYSVLPMFLRDCFLHGRNCVLKVDPMSLTLEIRKYEQKIKVTISDNGVAPDAPLQFSDSDIKMRENYSIGLSNVQSRLQLQFGSQADLHFSSKKNTGATVTLIFPCTEELT